MVQSHSLASSLDKLAVMAMENCPLSLSLETSVARSNISFVFPLIDRKISALCLSIEALMKKGSLDEKEKSPVSANFLAP